MSANSNSNPGFDDDAIPAIIDLAVHQLVAGATTQRITVLIGRPKRSTEIEVSWSG